MKKLLGYSLLLTLLFSFSCVFFSCDSDSDPEPEPPTNSIVGQWKGTFSDGYQIIIFNNDGTYRLLEYDSGEWQFDDTGEYSYNATKGILKFKEDDNDPWVTFEISSLDKDKFIIKNYEDGRDWVFYRNSDSLPERVDNRSLIGTWMLNFDEGSYCWLIFNDNGTVRHREYDDGEWDADDLYNYTYINNILQFTYSNGQIRETIEVISLSNTALVLKDWPDEGVNTFIKQ